VYEGFIAEEDAAIGCDRSWPEGARDALVGILIIHAVISFGWFRMRRSRTAR
jgi:hypothetical protein